MDEQLEDSAHEIKRLQRFINDLVSLVALPAAWSGSEPSQIVEALLDTLLRLLTLDFIYARLEDPGTKAPVEVLRVSHASKLKLREQEILAALSDCLAGDGQKSLPLRAQLGAADFSIVSVPLGVCSEAGTIVAGSERPGFPGKTENLVLSVAANQASIGLQQARLLSKQRRIDDELDRRVSKRTVEPATLNEELRKEIAERKQAEEALRASEIKLRQVIDTIPALAWCNLPDGQNEFLSKRWHEYTGLYPEESHGWGWQVAFHPEDLPPLMRTWQEMLVLGEPGEIEARIRRHDGAYRWFLIRAEPLRDEGGKIVRWYGTSTDIEERKRAEEALKASEREFSLIINTIPALAWSAGPDGRNDFFNQRWLDYTGLSAEQSRDWGWMVAIHPHDVKVVTDYCQSSLTSGTAAEVEARICRFDGAYRWFLFRTDPLRDESGNVIRWYGTITDIDDDKRLEETLRANELSLRQIVDNLPGFVHTTSAMGEVEFLSRQTLEYFGKTKEELNDWSRLGIVHPDDLPRVVEAWRKSIETGHDYEVEQRNRRADGVYRWFQSRGRPVRNAEGEISAWYWLLTDVEDRKKAEEALQSNERNLGLIINTMPTLAWSARPDGSGEFFNQHYLDYVGLPLDKLQGWGWTVAVHPDDLNALSGVWQSILAAGKPGEAEARLRRFDGQYRWFLFRTNPMRDESGEILKWYGTNTDINDRKRAEEQLQRSEAFLAEGQNLARVGNFSWLVATNEIKWSEQIYRIFEFEPGVLITLDLIGSRVPPEDLPMMNDMVEKAQRGVSDFEYEHRIVMPDSSIKHLHLIAHLNRNHQGRLEYIGAVQDVTQRRLSDEALSRARSELAKVASVTSLGVLTASIAHEVNQPLSGIITNASTCLRMLDSDPPNVDGARETARRTIRDGNRASDVITRLRSLYSKKELSPELMDLNEAAREVTSLYLSELQRNRVIVRYELAEDLPPVTGDRIQLQQVILNLVRNASDAMSTVDDHPRELLIRTDRDEGDRIRLSVKDAGVGFGPQAADKLFEAFYTTKPDGMGIGLSISRSIIEAHNGRLWATANDGPGVTFSFVVPYC